MQSGSAPGSARCRKRLTLQPTAGKALPQQSPWRSAVEGPRTSENSLGTSLFFGIVHDGRCWLAGFMGMVNTLFIVVFIVTFQIVQNASRVIGNALDDGRAVFQDAP